MSDNEKKDITRIEDLSEFLHENEKLDEETEAFIKENSSPDIIPELPGEAPEFQEAEAIEGTISENEEEVNFGSFEEETPVFEETSEETPQEETSFQEESFEEESFSQPQEEEKTQDELTDFSENNFDSIDNSSEQVQENFEPAAKPEEKKLELPKEVTKAKETFNDVAYFMENMSFGNLAHEGNPPYSILLNNIKYREDLEEIIALLKQHELISEEDEARRMMERGQYLISRISEFAAIYLAHRLRVYDLDMQIGLSEEIHKPQNFSDPSDRGIVSKRSAFQNYTHDFEVDNQQVEMNDIVLTTFTNLDGFAIKAQLGLVSAHTIVDAKAFEKLEAKAPVDDDFDPERILREELEEDALDINIIYQELSEKLKLAAYDRKGSAVVGVEFHLTPLTKPNKEDVDKYQISITGNVVKAVLENNHGLEPS